MKGRPGRSDLDDRQVAPSVAGDLLEKLSVAVDVGCSTPCRGPRPFGGGARR